MLPGADLGSISNLVQPVGAVEPVPAVIAAADMRLQGLSRIEQFAIGQQIQAKVVSLFQDGTALVRMGETAARMVLPANARPGSSILLTLTSKDPRPTFSMQVESEGNETGDAEEAAVRMPAGYNAAGGSSSGRTLAQSELGINGSGPALRGAGLASAAANAGGVSADAGGALNAQGLPQSASLTLSTAGRMINNLLQAQADGPAAAITSRAPALPGPPSSSMPAAQIADALHDSVAFSGVFYESHVTEWVDGKRDLAALQREPQAQLGKSIDNTGLLTRPDAASTDIGKIVNMQLTTLDQQRVNWQGEVWPGQNMEWEISRDDSQTQGQEQQQQGGTETTPTWQSVVRFNFEHLGTVAASIRLIGNQIHMQIRTNNDSANEALRMHGSELADSMAAAGSSLDSLIVKREGVA
jgi:hypothetical protein